jgi:hypothetical protein
MDRAVFTSDPLVATLFRFFALEALLGNASDRQGSRMYWHRLSWHRSHRFMRH